MSFYQANSELILSLAKLTSALLIAFAAAPFLKRPALRATFWSGVFLILPTMIIATHGRTNLNILPQPSLAASPVEVRLQQPATALSPSSLSNPEKLPEVARLVSVAPSHEINWVFTVFSVGVVFSLLPILVSLLRIRLMRKKPAGVSAMAEWERIGPQTSPAVPLYLTNCPSAPFTAGMIRAAVLLPECSVAWSPRRLRSTLLHEAAHITRRDSLVRGLASFVRAFLWFHPLVWLAHRQLVVAQEEACDEIVLSAGIAPDEYAEDLLETVKHSRNTLVQSLHMGRWSQLGTRIQIILSKKQTEPQTITMKNIATIILGISAATYSLSTLGFSETPGAAKAAADPNQVEQNAEDPAKAAIEKKLNTIMIPRIEFKETSIEEAVDFLRLKATELDTKEMDPEKKGVNFVLKLPKDRPMPVIPSLRLKNVPLGTVLKYICDLTEMRYEVDEFAVTISPLPVAEE